MDEDHIEEAFSRNVVSATECTGLIPFALVSESQLEAYQALYEFEATAAAPRHGKPFGFPVEKE